MTAKVGKFPVGISLKDQIRLSAQLNDNNSLLKFDVVRFSTIINKKLMDHIRNEGLKIYESNSKAIS
jgi:hypothetical protein